jgi:hypothetical protein
VSPLLPAHHEKDTFHCCTTHLPAGALDTHRMISWEATRILGLLFLVILWITSCGRRPLTDDELIAAFRRDRTIFDAVVRDTYANPFVCSFQNDCVPKNVKPLQERLKQTLGLPVEAVYIKRELCDSLWIPIETYGFLSISSWTRGYVYCRCSLTPATQDTNEEMDNGVWYRPIGDGWMLFIAR